MSSAICFNLDPSKILSSGNGLSSNCTEYQSDQGTISSACLSFYHKNYDKIQDWFNPFPNDKF